MHLKCQICIVYINKRLALHQTLAAFYICFRLRCEYQSGVNPPLCLFHFFSLWNNAIMIFFPVWNSSNRLIWNHLCGYELVAAGDCSNIVFFPLLIYFQVMKSSHRLKTGSAHSLICSHLYMSSLWVCVRSWLPVETSTYTGSSLFLQMYSSTVISWSENRAEPCYYVNWQRSADPWPSPTEVVAEVLEISVNICMAIFL